MTRRALILTLLGLLFAVPAEATPPPLDLVRAALASRQLPEGKFVVTAMGKELKEFNATVSKDGVMLSDQRSATKDSKGELKALFIALVATNPIDLIQAKGLLDPTKSEVRVVSNAFAFRYGTTPSLTVSKEGFHLLGFSFLDGQDTYRASLEYQDAKLKSVQISKGKRLVMTVRVR